MSHRMHPGIEVIALALLVHAAGDGALAADGASVVQLHFSADPAGFTEVSDSVSLMQALRENLVLDAVSPLDIELVVHLGYRVFQSRSDGMETMGFDQSAPESVQGAGIYLSVDRGNPQQGPVRDLPVNTFADWDELEAWNQFRIAVEGQLAYSPWSSGAFQPGDDGVIPLRVEAVLDGDEVVAPDGERMVFEVTAQTNYRTGSRFGSPTPPEGYTQSLQTVQLVLAPAAAEAGSDTTAGASSGGVDQAAEAATGTGEPGGLITGVYGIENGNMVVAEVDGQLVFYNGNLPEPPHWPLTLVEGTRYSARYHETPIAVKFSVDEGGRAFAMTIVQDGRELKLPRTD